jgi:hypothetical protein
MNPQLREPKNRFCSGSLVQQVAGAKTTGALAISKRAVN